MPETVEGQWLVQGRIVRDSAPWAAPYPVDWEERGGADFWYVRDRLLVRDEYLERVRALVPDLVAEGALAGVAAVRLPEGSDVIRTVDLITARLGRGVGAPEYVLSVCPTGCCPATEPEVPQEDCPDPPVSSNESAGRGVRVVVVDTGLRLGAAARFPWLHGVTGDPEKSYDPFTGELAHYAGHGTFVAGMVRAMAPAADVVVYSHFQPGGVVTETAMVQALDRALLTGPDVVVLAAGTTAYDPTGPLGLGTFVRDRLPLVGGVTLIAAAGNNGDAVPFYPAAFRSVTGVGALDAARTGLAPYSDRGGWVDVFAPGTDLVNVLGSGTYTCVEPPNIGQVRVFDGLARWSGTSFATPLVAGLVAARMSATGEKSAQAVAALLAQAPAIPGVGRILLP